MIRSSGNFLFPSFETAAGTKWLHFLITVVENVGAEVLGKKDFGKQINQQHRKTNSWDDVLYILHFLLRPHCTY